MKSINKITRFVKSEFRYFRFKPEPLLFDHIPKCAGTTVNIFLDNFYPSRLKFKVGASKARVEKFKKLSTKDKQQYKFINGHFANNLAEDVKQSHKTIILFREPIDRIISHYNYVKRSPKNYLYK